jgi:hypothetical protein
MRRGEGKAAKEGAAEGGGKLLPKVKRSAQSSVKLMVPSSNSREFKGFLLILSSCVCVAGPLEALQHAVGVPCTLQHSDEMSQVTLLL